MNILVGPLILAKLVLYLTTTSFLAEDRLSVLSAELTFDPASLPSLFFATTSVGLLPLSGNVICVGAA